MGADELSGQKPFGAGVDGKPGEGVVSPSGSDGQNLRMEAGIITVHGVEIDPLARKLRLHGKSLDLTPREFDLLYFFARHPGEVFSRQALLDQLCGATSMKGMSIR